MTVLARTSLDPAGLVGAMPREVRAGNPAGLRVRMMAGNIPETASTTGRRRFRETISSWTSCPLSSVRRWETGLASRRWAT